MKSFAILVASALSVSAVFAAPKTAEDFKRAFRTASDSGNPDAITSMVWFGDASPADRESYEQAQTLLGPPPKIESVELIDTPDYINPVMVANGTKHEPTAPIVGCLEVTYVKNKSGRSGTITPYAMIDGGYYLVASKSTPVDWTGPPDHPLAISIEGGKDKALMTITYNASGVTLTDSQTVNAQSFSTAFRGQYFEEVTITTEHSGGSLTFTLTDGEKQIHQSKPLQGKGSINYTRTE